MTAAMTAGMIVTIAAVAVIATVSRTRLLAFFARTETVRTWLGRTLETGGALLVLLFGALVILGAQTRCPPTACSAGPRLVFREPE